MFSSLNEFYYGVAHIRTQLRLCLGAISLVLFKPRWRGTHKSVSYRIPPTSTRNSCLEPRVSHCIVKVLFACWEIIS